VAGDVMTHFLAADGSVADPDLEARTLSIGLDVVRRCPTVVAVAAGDQKKAATLAALAGGLATTLVVESSIASYLLAEHSGRGNKTSSSDSSDSRNDNGNDPAGEPSAAAQTKGTPQ